jgi:hypothetical protein
MSFEEILDERIFDADYHSTKENESLRGLVTVGKVLELYTSRFWE